MTQSVSLREKIRSGPTLLGFSLGSMSPAVVEVAGLCGIDFVWIEGEHGSVDLMHVEHLCRAAELRGVIPMLRVPDGSRASVLGGLETGARIIVIPQCHTPELAAQIAEYGKFPPEGKRGFNFGSRGLGYGSFGTTPAEVFPRANDSTVLLPQIESVEGVRNAEAIIRTPGIDGVLVGPGDLSMDMGIPGSTTDDELISAIDGVFALAHRHRKIIATVSPSAELTKRWLAVGVHMLNIGGDLGFVRGGLTGRIAQMREMMG